MAVRSGAAQRAGSQPPVHEEYTVPLPQLSRRSLAFCVVEMVKFLMQLRGLVSPDARRASGRAGRKIPKRPKRPHRGSPAQVPCPVAQMARSHEQALQVRLVKRGSGNARFSEREIFTGVAVNHTVVSPQQARAAAPQGCVYSYTCVCKSVHVKQFAR
jgi:hypothetical protein